MCGRSRTNGCFRTSNPDQLEIDQERVEQFEAGSRPVNWRERTTRGMMIEPAGVTVLHELVHWADFKNNGELTRTEEPYHDLGARWEWVTFAIWDDTLVGDVEKS